MNEMLKSGRNNLQEVYIHVSVDIKCINESKHLEQCQKIDNIHISYKTNQVKSSC